MNVDELIAQIRADLVSIDENLRWAYFDGHQRTNAAPPRRRRDPGPAFTLPDVVEPPRIWREPAPLVKPPPPPPRNPDAVTAPLHDIGLGVHRSRDAWRRAAPLLARAELRLTVAGVIAAPGSFQVRLLAKGPHTLERVTRAIAVMKVRLDPIDPATLNPDHLRHVRRELADAARLLDQCWRLLDAVFAGDGGHDEDDVDNKTPWCRVCGIRRQEPKAGKRCNTCARWFHRHGYERPTSRDGIAAARDAARRRRARGEGWGSA